MEKSIVVIGNSQLSFLVVHQLEEKFGDHTHIDIYWIKTTARVYPVANPDFDPQKYLNTVKVINSPVKSLNLRDRRVITGKRSLEYDLVFIDQTPVYTSLERQKITDQFETLLSTLRSNENRGVATKAKVALNGQDFDSLNLALALNDRKNRDSSASVAALRVEVSGAPDNAGSFLRSQGLSTRKSQFPGVVLKPPLPLVKSHQIRGLKVDLAGRAITLATLEPVNHQNVFVLDSSDRQWQNIARSDWHLAGQIVSNIQAKLEGTLEQPIDHLGSKLLLRSAAGQFVSLGSMVSSRNRARAIVALDRQFWRRLLR
jgi:hypothetical protein